MGRIIFAGLIFLLVIKSTVAQEIVTDGYFHEDSMKVGEAVNFSLYAKYPKQMEVIFPDSTFTFLPFEFYSKQFFSTKTDSLFAYDSAIYTLASFEVDSVQYMNLPVFILNGKDSTKITTYEDSIYLKALVIQMPDSIAFKDNTMLQSVNKAFNYPYLLIGLTLLIILIIVLTLVFGKTVKRKIKAYRLRKSYEKFSLEFERGIGKIKRDKERLFIEEVLIVWKEYMEKLEDRPFTKYTTKEIIKAGYGDSLSLVLKNIDRSIYGNMNDDEMHKNFESLEDFTLDQYKQKQKEVQHG